MPKVSIKKKKKGIRYRCDAERQAIRYNVQRRVGSTRHELMRQLPPVPRPVSRKLLVRKERILAEIPGCVYCGADATTQDHFEPLVINGMPSGIIPTDLDVVPCCAWCNSSKGGRKWTVYMNNAKRKRDADHEHRCAVLRKYADFREKHEQRWDVEKHSERIRRLNTMIEECHAFMQSEINKAVHDMHTASGIIVHSRNMELEWGGIQIQLSNCTFNGTNSMAQVDVINDIRKMNSNGKRACDPDHTESPPATKKKVEEPKDQWNNFCNRIRSAPNWVTNVDTSEFKDVTKEGKSKRQLFVLTNNGAEQFCMVGRVMDSRLSAEELMMPTEFQKSDKHTDLELHITMRTDGSLPEKWPTYTDDILSAQEAFCNLREMAIRDAMMPIFQAGKPMTGMNASQMKRFQKHSKDPDKLYEALDEAWGGTGMNANRDIVRFKRRCYNISDLDNSREFMDNWLQVRDENGDPMDYIKDNTAINRGDLVLVWFRVLAQCTAGNFHVSMEPRSVMRLCTGDAGGSAEGSIGFAASMAKAMARNDV